MKDGIPSDSKSILLSFTCTTKNAGVAIDAVVGLINVVMDCLLSLTVVADLSTNLVMIRVSVRAMTKIGDNAILMENIAHVGFVVFVA